MNENKNKVLETVVGAGKFIGEMAITSGVTRIVSNAVLATTPAPVKGIGKACIMLGSFAISNMVSKKAIASINEDVDDFKKSIKGENNGDK